MHKIAVVVLYFGKLPECFPVWWVSARCNETIDFLFFTDNMNIETEGNIYVQHMTFSECRTRVQSIFDFGISLESPYKLCDFKPAYGDIFRKELQGYDFWGYCDVDLVFGNLRKFLTESVLNSNERILIDGHLSLYKNNEKMTKLYCEQGDYPEYNFQEVYASAEICFFDEYRGMELKCIRKNVLLYSGRKNYVDIPPKFPRFYNEKRQLVIGEWMAGKLTVCSPNGIPQEKMYMHICRRKMELNGSPRKDGCVFIVPGKMVCNTVWNERLFEFSSGGKLYGIKFYIERYCKLRKQYSIWKLYKRRKRMKDVAKYKQMLLEQNRK